MNMSAFYFFLFYLLFSWFLWAETFQINLIRKDLPSFRLGGGLHGAASLFSYADSKFVVLKKLGKTLDEFIEGSKNAPENSIKKNMQELTTEVCANYELYNSSLIVNSFGLWLGRSSKTNELFFALEPMLGGNGNDINEFFKDKYALFTVEWLRFFIANIALGIEYVHSQKWAWRDVKLANIALDHKSGYPKIFDFGESERLIDSLNYDEDWKRLGSEILGKFYTSMALIEPQYDQDRLAMFFATKKALETGVIKDLEQLKRLAMFNDFDWAALENQKMTAPFIPADNIDYLNQTYKNRDLIGLAQDSPNLLRTDILDDGFILDNKLIKKIKELPIEGVRTIKSPKEFCEIMDNDLYERRQLKSPDSSI